MCAVVALVLQSGQRCFHCPPPCEEELPIHEDVAFLLQFRWEVFACSLAQFILIPIVFFFGQQQLLWAACASIGLHVCAILAIQLRLQERFIEWLGQHADQGWQELLREGADMSTPLPYITCLSSSSLAFLTSIPEILDPALDAWTAATAHHMMTTSIEEKFELSWRPLPAVGTVVCWLGLPGLLMLLLGVSSAYQLWKMYDRARWAAVRLAMLQDAFPFQDLHDLSYSRWCVWVQLYHLADTGGLLLLHSVFGRMLEAEIRTSDDKRIWPVADRNTAFRCKIFAEAVPALWLQVSLLSFTFEQASASCLVTTGFSVACSLFNIQKHVRLTLRSFIEAWNRQALRMSEIQEAFMIFVCVVCPMMCMIRLGGLWTCRSHILNITTGCVPLHHQS
mmetsp:Transcript_41315/g.76879  ORF Transcript_41315/g.76879 Transcript_41315/m.76879 type:complete len:393 (-) Transcript_41315:239-1417(-)